VSTRASSQSSSVTRAGVGDEDVAGAHIAVDGALRCAEDELPRLTDGPYRLRRHQVQADVPAPVAHEQLAGRGEARTLWPPDGQPVNDRQGLDHPVPVIVIARRTAVDELLDEYAVDVATSIVGRFAVG